MNISEVPTNEEDIKRMTDELKSYLHSRISIEGLQEKTKDIPPKSLRNINFLQLLCMSKYVSLDMVEHLLQFYPEAPMESFYYLMGYDYYSFGERCNSCWNCKSKPQHNCSNAVSTLLHVACQNEKCPSSVIDLLLSKKHPLARKCPCIIENVCGRWGLADDYHVEGLPITCYLARVTNDIEITVVKSLVQDSRDLSATFGGTKSTPLHIVLVRRNVADMYEIIKFIIEANPSSLRVMDVFNRLPLHMALSNDKISLEIVQLLMKHYPEAASVGCNWMASTRRRDSRLPLHYLVGQREGYASTYAGESHLSEEMMIGILQLILGAYTEAIYMEPLPDDQEYVPFDERRHGEGHLPTVISRRKREPTSAVHMFLEEQFASALRTYDERGRLPLHSVLCNKAQLHVVKTLVKEYPAALQCADNENRLPLHVACEVGCMNGSVPFLCEPFGAAVCDINMNNPLHYACRGSSYCVLQWLLAKYPALVSKRNAEGKLPVQLLCEMGATTRDDRFIETTFMLLRMFPDSIR